MKIEQATASTIKEIGAKIEPRIRQAKSLEEACQEMCTELHSRFNESVALARIFLTVPFGSLPQGVKDFVQNLAKSAKAEAGLKPSTPVLSLLGTRGQESDWNDRRESNGHLGIPLISSTFVGAIPMISRLLRELGVPIDWVDSHDSEIIKKTIGQSAGLFFVEDASSATDHEGRKIIAAQDFVSGYKIRTVFGTGEVYPNGQILVNVLFCRDLVPRVKAEQFPELLGLLKNSTASLVQAGKFSPEVVRADFPMIEERTSRRKRATESGPKVEKFEPESRH